MPGDLDQLIARWWTEFTAKAPQLDALFKGVAEWDLPGWMEQTLLAIDPALMWEFGPAVNGTGHRLVITPESRFDLRPLARMILSRAPALEGWEFYEYRLPEKFELANATVQGRTGDDLSDVTFAASRGDFNRVDLLLVCDRYTVDDSASLTHALVATETLLGEERLNGWIGTIEVAPRPPADSPNLPEICDLRADVEDLIAEVQDDLPVHPWCLTEIDEGWGGFELEPVDAEDYPEQSDLIVGISVAQEMWLNALSGVPFSSHRFSRWGEVFCYLKIDGCDGLEGCTFSDRTEIEEALNLRLRPESLGSVVGGGTGKRYIYIELALTDMTAAWDAMRELLQQGGVPRRTWLLFHDSELRSLWYGLWDETPLPPMAGTDQHRDEDD